MNDNMNFMYELCRKYILTKYHEGIPSIEQIYEGAETFRKGFTMCPVSDVEMSEIKDRLAENIVHTIGDAHTLQGRDSEHQSWYFVHNNDGFFWDRYKVYLGEKWSPDVVEKLHYTTNKIMDNLGDPTQKKPFQRRGLLLGDVQSGKTATYTAICNKAADAGYKVIIILAGMMENLRIQTQSRLDMEFLGLESKYVLDKKADNAVKNTDVGVGKIKKDSKRRISTFTSVTRDFNRSILNSLGFSLKSLNGTALFVVKKNKSVLNNLQQWLTKDELMLDLPMLLIDDEADNASINTNSDEKDPTAINAAINKILRSFKQASYLGITATPFANIFIDPSIDEDGASKDLFPKDFITVLPSPDNYIGADKIFGVGFKADSTDRVEAEYDTSLISINNSEQKDFYYFKHKKDLADKLDDLPESMKEAVIYFILATAISDARYDNQEHRSMMINVSRFTDVQNITADLLEDFMEKLKSTVENYAQLPIKEALKIPELFSLKRVWDKHHLKDISGFNWEKLQHQYLFKAIRRIEVRAVNQKTGAKSLDYHNYANIGMRVIAIGGNSLSRGLTLEGLCVSYFYRNTMMYDTLLQMGRWFGYRTHYDDLFKIWMGEDAVSWYEFITDATAELKDELIRMEKMHLTPEDFGLRVRAKPGALIVTARNKMRNGTSVYVPITVSGKMTETSRVFDDVDTIKQNDSIVKTFIKTISKLNGVQIEDDPNSNAKIWKNIPKKYVVDLVRNYKSHPWNLNYQSEALADYIAEDKKLLYWDVGIPFGSVDLEYTFNIDEHLTVSVKPEERFFLADRDMHMLKVSGRHVRIGSGACCKIGLSKEQIENARLKAKINGDSLGDKYFLSQERAPLLLIHVLYNPKHNEDKMPDTLLALGVAFPGSATDRKAKYIVNTTELKKWIDVDELEDDDYNDDIR